MAHRFSIKEIAAQAGLGTATVDRVLHQRAHVSARTAARVAAALAELERLELQLVAKGRVVWVDVVVEAPLRFSAEVKAAAEAAITKLSPVVVRPRFTLHEVMSDQQMSATLKRIARRGTQGICLKARNTPGVQAALRLFHTKGIPVVSLVTDIDGQEAYAGLDNAQAGRVAARLIAREVQTGTVLTSQSRDDFTGETARIAAFHAALGQLAPRIRCVAVSEGGGLNAQTGQAAEAAVTAGVPVQGVYSVGGGNRAIVAALQRVGSVPVIYVAHDLDRDNLALLARGAITFVLYHDLEADLQAAFRHILQAHGLIPAAKPAGASDVQVILRENVPAKFRDQTGR